MVPLNKYSFKKFDSSRWEVNYLRKHILYKSYMHYMSSMEIPTVRKNEIRISALTWNILNFLKNVPIFGRRLIPKSVFQLWESVEKILGRDENKQQRDHGTWLISHRLDSSTRPPNYDFCAPCANLIQRIFLSIFQMANESVLISYKSVSCGAAERR